MTFIKSIIFYDAPIEELKSRHPYNKTYVQIPGTLSIISLRC